MISELYMMNRQSWDFICFQCITSLFLYFFIFSQKKKSQSKFSLGFFELVLALLPRG